VGTGTDTKRKTNVQGTDCLKHKVWVCQDDRKEVLSWVAVNNKTRHLCVSP